ncbi:oligosaccharide flippase family protein, partial [Candidatus Pacearchaeota archaeon]|nr:oligosaccharide flippase family protein [Candidatus Pacearchaeota archaeon]
LNGWGYWALAGRTAIFAIVQAAGSWIFCQWRPGLPDFKSGIRPLLEFGRNMLGSNFLIYFTESFDKVLIGRFFGAQSLGHYSRAYHLFLAPAHQLSVPLTSVAVATLSRLVNDAEKYRRYFLNAFTMVAFVAFPISGILTITGKDIILLLLGPQWEKAGEIFCVFGVGVGIQILYATHMWLHMSLGKTDRLVRWSIIGSIVICIFFLVGMPFGPQGIAASYIVSIHILIGPSLWYAGKPIQLSFSSIVSKTWKYYLAALFAGLICWFFFYGHVSMAAVFSSLNIFLRLILATILYTFTYLILIIIFYKNAKPIFQFIIALRDMMPTRG